MVQALIKLNENSNRVLNIVKAKYDLTDKGEAIEFIISKYIEMEDEPELKPEFIERIKKIQKQKRIRVKDFAKRYGLEWKNVRTQHQTRSRPNILQNLQEKQKTTHNNPQKNRRNKKKTKTQIQILKTTTKNIQQNPHRQTLRFNL